MVFRTGDWFQGKMEKLQSGWTKPHCFQTCCYKRSLNSLPQLALEEPFPSFLLLQAYPRAHEDKVGTHHATKRKWFMEHLEKAVCGHRGELAFLRP